MYWALEQWAMQECTEHWNKEPCKNALSTGTVAYARIYWALEQWAMQEYTEPWSSDPCKNALSPGSVIHAGMYWALETYGFVRLTWWKREKELEFFLIIF